MKAEVARFATNTLGDLLVALLQVLPLQQIDKIWTAQGERLSFVLEPQSPDDKKCGSITSPTCTGVSDW